MSLTGDFATRDIDATFISRVAEVPMRLGWFVYVDWPGDTLRAHVGGVRDLTIGGNTWRVVDPAAALIEFSGVSKEGGAQRATIGLRGLAFGSANIPEEAAVIGVEAELYLGAYNAAFSDAVLHARFTGWVETPLMIETRETDNGIVVDLSMELTDAANPRRRLSRHHAIGTETPGDTAPKLLQTVPFDPPWPS